MKRTAKISIVLGAGYGDEGKGKMVSYLCEKDSMKANPLVVRFNGGHQCGHTVEYDGMHHVFSNFGSGTLQNRPTYWSRFCTFNPLAMMVELDKLVSLKSQSDTTFHPRLYIDKLCPVTTFYDIAYNRALEKSRDGGGRHGSCGVGFGNTIERHENSPYKLFAGDLLFPEVVKQKLWAIRTYYANKLSSQSEKVQEYYQDEANGDFDAIDDRFLNETARLPQLVLGRHLEFVIEQEFLSNPEYNHIIFEGGQGILLDMDFGFFPHVTRSNTTSKNAMELIEKYFNSTIDVYYMHRAYQTRHGAGPMSNEHKPIVLINNQKETNVNNPWQQQFRTGILDLDLLKYAIECDKNHLPENVNRTLVMTCLDQIGSDYVPFTIKGHVSQTRYYEFPKMLGLKNGLYCFGPNTEDLKEFNSQRAIDYNKSLDEEVYINSNR